jgi:predicted nucleic acid-binding protein
MMVLDASAAIEFLMQSPTGERVELRIKHRDLFAPELVDLEIVQALRNLLRSRTITHWRGELALNDLSNLALIRYSHEPLVARIWELRGNLSAYDAAYVAIAESLDVPLITCDAKLAAAPGHTAVVELIA